MRLAELVATSDAIAATSGRLDKVDRLASLLKRLSPEEDEVGVAFLSGSPLQGRIGVAGSVVAAARSTPPATEPTLNLDEVDAAFGRIAVTSGRGSAAGTHGGLPARRSAPSTTADLRGGCGPAGG